MHNQHYIVRITILLLPLYNIQLNTLHSIVDANVSKLNYDYAYEL